MSERKEAVIFLFSNSDPKLNGGYVDVGDGNLKTELHISKGCETVVLDDCDILNLFKTLSFINPKLN